MVTAVGYLVKGAPAESHRSQIAWYENTGKSNDKRWKKHLISRELPAAIHGQLVDMDKDGDPDLVMAHGMRVEADPMINRHQIVWYENVRHGKQQPTWKQHKVGPLPYAFETVAGDIDGDGDVDIAATAWSKGDRVCWFENLGSGRWEEHVVRTKYYAANQVVLADLDGDKRLDIIAGADDGSRRVQGSLELRWWQQKK